MYIRKLTSQVILDYGRAEVHTQAGTLRGVISDGTCIFRGVRYAQAQRFHLPEPVTPWEGVKEAITYGNACPEIFTCVPHDQYTAVSYTHLDVYKRQVLTSSHSLPTLHKITQG